ncbi:hypothetical protein CBM2637_A130050 [Cupriavidus taiwanensis]|nr:hypothetical protein CBM2637_A130050 [Cupriavidus taiwanensis]
MACSWPITYWSRLSRISWGVGRSERAAVAASFSDAVASSRMISLHRSMHSSQMNTDGPAISFLTSCWLLPQKEQYRSFSLDEPFLSAIGISHFCSAHTAGRQAPRRYASNASYAKTIGTTGGSPRLWGQGPVSQVPMQKTRHGASFRCSLRHLRPASVASRRCTHGHGGAPHQPRRARTLSIRP